MWKYQIFLKPFILQLFIGCMLAITAGAQNYVHNGSFEEKGISCSYYPSTTYIIFTLEGPFAVYVQEVDYSCIYWRAYTNGTPDYFNICDPSGTVSVPKNYVGYQYAADGNAYTGLYTYLADSPDYKEYITVDIPELEQGKRYVAYLSVSLSDSSRFATDDLGIFLYKEGPPFVPTVNTLQFKPQVSYKKYGPITDTAVWTRLAGTIIADSGYKSLVIGGFTHYDSLTLTEVNPAGKNYAYYYIDSVVVKPCKSLRNVIVPATSCAGDVNIPYEIHDCDLDTANVFTVELSNYTGTFDFPLVFPTKTICTYKSAVSDTFRCHIPLVSFYSSNYRIRVTSTHPADTFFTEPFTINPQPVPKALNTGPACEGDGIQLSVSALGTSYAWTGPNGFSLNRADTIIFNPGLSLSGKYVVTVHYNNCVGSDSTEVLIKPLPAIPIISASNPACEGQELLLDILNAETGTIYLWTGPDSFYSNDIHVVIPDVQQSAAGNYRARADKNGCNTEKDIAVTVQPVYVPEVLSNSPVHAGYILSLETINPEPGASYEWKGPNNFFAPLQNEYIEKVGPQHEGIYYLTAAFKGCTATASTVVDVIIPKDTGKISLYPNPNKGNFTIEGYVKTDDKISFFITDARGQMVHTGLLQPSGKLLKKEIALPALANSCYFLKLWIDGGERIFQFTVIQ